MAHINVSRQHSLQKMEARAAVERVAQDLHQAFDINYRWDGDILRFSRTGAKGTITVSDRAVQVEMKLGLPLSLMQGAIEKQTKQYLEQELE